MSKGRVRLTVGEAGAGRRLDRFCADHLPDLSRTQIQSLNAAGGITVDGRVRPDAYAVTIGETIELHPDLLADRAPGPPAPQSIAVPVVYEDDAVVVVNKPAGLVVHPAHGNRDGTLVNALLGRGTSLSSLGGGDRPGVVHRLDKDTSGLMVLAKTDEAYRSLAAEIKDRRLEKTYHAIAIGNLKSRRLTIEAPIARHPVHRQRMAVVRGMGRPASTDVFVVDSYRRFDYIRLITRTGRTHQIRVHLAHVGNPLLGDPVYGGRRQRGPQARATFDKLLKLLPRHSLHASRLSFTHPETGRRLTFTTALPSDMRLALETIYREDRAKEA